VYHRRAVYQAADATYRLSQYHAGGSQVSHLPQRHLSYGSIGYAENKTADEGSVEGQPSLPEIQRLLRVVLIDSAPLVDNVEQPGADYPPTTPQRAVEYTSSLVKPFSLASLATSITAARTASPVSSPCQLMVKEPTVNILGFIEI